MQRIHRFFHWSACVAVLALSGCASSEPDAKTAPAAAETAAQPTVKIEELREGSGNPAKVGDYLMVHYTGWLMDGTKFDSSFDRPNQEPLKVNLGKREVIPGWEKGLEGMKAGGKRRLVIPPELAYGKEGRPRTIPPNATLIFEVELVSIK